MTCDKRFHVRYSLIKDFDEPEGATLAGDRTERLDR